MSNINKNKQSLLTQIEGGVNEVQGAFYRHK
jgi:hypothetical protein